MRKNVSKIACIIFSDMGSSCTGGAGDQGKTDSDSAADEVYKVGWMLGLVETIRGRDQGRRSIDLRKFVTRVAGSRSVEQVD